LRAFFHTAVRSMTVEVGLVSGDTVRGSSYVRDSTVAGV